MLRNPFIPHRPTPRQALFLLHDQTEEAFYGGAAGGGKSDGLLMAAAQFLHVPGYAALLLRESFPDLMQPDALIPRAKDWWVGKPGALWNSQEKRFTFRCPGGGTSSVGFGYLERDDHVYQYQGAAYQFIGIDELTQHTEFRYRYLFSRLRKPSSGPLAGVPLRMRAGSNPGGKGHEWVRGRFLPDSFFRLCRADAFSRPHWHEGRLFVPSRKEDNPHLDRDSYDRSLSKLDPVTRAQLDEGDWQAYQGGRFKREWFRYYRRHGTGYALLATDGTPARYVDAPDVWTFATVDPATSEKHAGDPTVCSVWGVDKRRELLWLDCLRAWLEIPDILPAVHALARRHGCKFVGIEDTAFQVGLIQEARRRPGFPEVVPLKPQGQGKLVRATPAINRCASGRLWLPENGPPWVQEVESELVRFTGDESLDAHDDIVDTLAYAAQVLAWYEDAGTKTFRPYVLAGSN